MSIQITIRINKSENEKAPKAFASAFVNEIFHVDGIKIWKNKTGLSVQMPGYSNKGNNGRTFYNQHFRYDSENSQNLLNEEVIKAYKTAVAENVPAKKEEEPQEA